MTTYFLTPQKWNMFLEGHTYTFKHKNYQTLIASSFVILLTLHLKQLIEIVLLSHVLYDRTYATNYAK